MSYSITATEQCIYDLNGNMLAVLNGTGGVIEEYIYLNGIAVLLADSATWPVDSDGDGIGNVCDQPPGGC